MKQFKKEVVFNFKYQLNFNRNYKVAECGRIINIKTSNVINETVVGYTRGYWIERKFISKTKIESYYEPIERLSLKKLKEIYPNMF